MKTLILSSVLPFLACAALAQDTPPDKAAPAETVKKAHPAAWLGIAMKDSDGKVAVTQVVPGSPADKAGLQFGDLLLKIGDTAVEGQRERVLETIGKQKPGDAIELQMQRGDQDLVIRIELAERPAQLDGDFRGEFHSEEKIPVPPLRGKKLDGEGKTLKETKRAIERVKEDRKRDAGELHPEYKKMENKYKLLEDLSKPSEEAKKKLESRVELDSPKEADGGKLFHYYLDRKWPNDKEGGKEDGWTLRLGVELPLFKWMEQNKKAAGKRQTTGDDYKQLLRFSVPQPFQEAAIWKRVQDSIGRTLKESKIDPDVIEKVMKAVDEARRGDPEKNARRVRLQAEAAKVEAQAARLETELQAARKRAEELREQMHSSGPAE